MKGPISRDRAAALRGGRGGLGRSVLVGLAHLAQSCGMRDVLQSGWDPVPSKRMRLAEAATRLRQMLKAFENGTTAEPLPPPVPCAGCVIS